MPELPEVQTITSDLNLLLSGAKPTAITILWKKVLENTTAEELDSNLTDTLVRNFSRRAKYIIMHLKNNKHLVFHLRMTGRLTITRESLPDEKFLEWKILFADGLELHFHDQRRFGRLWFFPTTKELEKFFTALNLGVEPLSEEFTEEVLSKLLKRSSIPLKQFLLDQTAIAGIGNIYANEILWEACLHPETLTTVLKKKQRELLYKSIKVVLAFAIEKRGTSYSDFRDALGLEGDFQYFLCAHNKAGTPCPRCGTPIVKTMIAQRGTYLCLACQKQQLN
ncbi:MAG: DNA-formamidopyrimidine glycosylase [bacterium]